MFIQFRKTVLACIVALQLWNCTQVRAFSGGTGEANDEYQIATADDLLSIGSDPNLLDKYFILIDDINLDPSLLNGEPFDRAVIAPATDTDADSVFTGSFDGDGHVIHNLTISVENGSTVGLFGRLGSGAHVGKLGLLNVNIDAGGGVVGAFAGENQGHIELCYSTGRIKGDTQTGGLVGDNKGQINKCYSTAEVTGRFLLVGGLAGTNRGGDISECYFAGVVTSTQAQPDARGIAGDDSGVVDSTFWHTDNNPDISSLKGDGRTDTQMKDESTFEGWDRVEWHIQSEYFPELRVFIPQFIEDNNLFAVVNETLSKLLGEPIKYPSDDQLLLIESLEAGRKGVQTLNGLQYVENLVALDVNSNDINDLTPLEGLTKLETLILAGNQIEAIDLLSGLNLQTLSLSQNPIQDFSPISGLNDLGHLELDHCNMDDLDLASVAWKNLQRLQVLHLSGNSKLSNLMPLADLAGAKAITKLYIRDNGITDVTGLEPLKTLQELYLDNTHPNQGNRIESVEKLYTLSLPSDAHVDIEVLLNLLWPADEYTYTRTLFEVILPIDEMIYIDALLDVLSHPDEQLYIDTLLDLVQPADRQAYQASLHEAILSLDGPVDVKSFLALMDPNEIGLVTTALYDTLLYPDDPNHADSLLDIINPTDRQAYQEALLQVVLAFGDRADIASLVTLVYPQRQCLAENKPKLRTLKLIGNPLNREAYVTLELMHEVRQHLCGNQLILRYSPSLYPPTGIRVSKGFEPDAPHDHIRIQYDPHYSGPNNTSYYQVYRSETIDGPREALSVSYDDESAPYVQEEWLAATAFTDETAEPHRPYYYWVRAAMDANGLNGTGYSDMAVGFRGSIPPLWVGYASDVLDSDAVHGSRQNPYTSIQKAIEDAASGVKQEVILLPGHYIEPIDFRKKAITVRSTEGLPQADGTLALGRISTTWIDGGQNGTVVSFASGEDSASVLQGLTITGGRAAYGGGILCSNSSPTIRNCLIMGNRATASGGGISCFESQAFFDNCTIVGNRSDYLGGAIETCENGDVSRFTNCIIRHNLSISATDPASNSLWVSGTNSPEVNYSIIDAEWLALGVDNNDREPPFIDSGDWGTNQQWIPGDYHMVSRAGQYDVNQGKWVRDMEAEPGGPCIDRGHGEFALEPYPNGSRLNLGVYGGTPEASKSRQPEIYMFDLDAVEPNFVESSNGDPYWKKDGQWEFGPPKGGGGVEGGGPRYPDPESGLQGGTNVIGVNLHGNYETGDPNLAGKSFYLTAGPFDCTGWQGIILDFARWLNTGTNVNHLLEGSYDNKATWMDLREEPYANKDREFHDNAWEIESIDLGVRDPNFNNNVFYIRWGYTYGNDWPRGASSWNIDEIAILGEEMEIDEHSASE